MTSHLKKSLLDIGNFTKDFLYEWSKMIRYEDTYTHEPTTNQGAPIICTCWGLNLTVLSSPAIVRLTDASSECVCLIPYAVKSG